MAAEPKNPAFSIKGLMGLRDEDSLPPLPNDADAEETNLVLQKHYMGFQETLLASVDRQVNTIQEKLSENDLELVRTHEEKNAIGVNLYKANVQIGRLNDHLSVTQKKQLKLQDTCCILESERDSMRKEAQSMAAINTSVITDLNAAKAKLEEETQRATRLSEINATYSSDLKIHRRIEAKIKNELQYVDQRRRVAENDLEDHKKIIEKLVMSRNEMDLIMEAQKQETGIANQTIAKMHREISTLKAEKEKMEKQWEECMNAMSKRDVTFQSVEQQKQGIEESLSVAEMEKRALRNELEKLTRNYTSKELECKGLEDQIHFLHSSLRSLETKQKETRGSLTEAQVAESLYKQELDKVSKHHSVAKEELERKSSTISDLKGKFVRLKADFDLKMRNEVIMLAAKKEDQVRTQAQVDIENTKKEELGKNIDLRHENAQLQMKVQEYEDEIRKLHKDKQTLDRSYTDINGHYNRLYEEAKHLMYDLERKEHDVNSLKAKLQDCTDNDPTIPWQMSMSKLQKDIATVKNENDNIQKMWLESQKDILKAKNEIHRLLDDNVYLRTQLGITDTIKIKTSEEIERTKSKEFEQKMEYTKLYGEFRKLQPLVDEYRQKTLHFEQKLTESKMLLQQEHENALTITNMLKAEIRRLQDERRDEKRNQMTDDRSNQALERKYILAKEMVLKLKQDRQELQRTCFELKTRADEMETRYFESQLNAKRMAEKAGRTVGEIAARLTGAPKKHTSQAHDIVLVQPQSDLLASLQNVPMPPPMWASLATTPRQCGSARTRTEPLPTDNTDVSSSLQNTSLSRTKTDLPDYAAWKLKIESLTSERKFLLTENAMLKSRIDELGAKLSKAERAYGEANQKISSFERDLKNCHTQSKILTVKCTKAEKLAASIEKQFKDARPNIKIDYSLMIEAEPSTQLLAALIFRESDMQSPANRKSLPSIPSLSASRKTTPAEDFGMERAERRSILKA